MTTSRRWFSGFTLVCISEFSKRSQKQLSVLFTRSSPRTLLSTLFANPGVVPPAVPLMFLTYLITLFRRMCSLNGSPTSYRLCWR